MKIYNIVLNVALKAISIIAFSASLFMVITHPLLPIVATLCYFLYLIILIKYPDSWVFFIFALLPISDFGMWSGNILYDEYDAFFLETLGFLFFRKKSEIKYSFKHEILFFCFFILFIESLVIGFWSYFDGGYNYDVHLSYWNSVRVGKGFLSAWFVWFYIRQQLFVDYSRTLKLMGFGMFVGLFCFSILVLWERHIFSSILYGNGLYDVLSTALDFSGTYRITGFFSGMHVGGTAIDGYLVCVLPLCFYMISKKYNKYLWVLSIVVFFLGIYCLIVTFTRMTIASCFFSMLIAMVMLIFQRNIFYEKYRYALLVYFVVFFGIIAGLLICYSNTGYQGLVFSMFDVAAAVLIGYYFNKAKLSLFVCSILVVVLSIYGIYDSLSHSKWHQDVSLGFALQEAVFFAILFYGLGFFLGWLLRATNTSLSVLRIPLFASAVVMFMAIGIMSTRMEQRFKGVGQDMLIRKDHWLNVIDSRTPDNFVSSFLGEGMGSMVRQYYTTNYNKKELQSYTLNKEDGKSVLKLGVGGYPFHQKIPLQPNLNYKLVVLIRSNSIRDSLSVDICHKHILFSEHWQPECVEHVFTSKDNSWERYEWTFNSGSLGSKGWSEWPVTLQIHNYGKSPIEVDSVEIFDLEGNQIVRNSNFDEELKYWFWTSDFEHLPWHSKQFFIHIWLEQGWVGVFLFALLLFFGFYRQIKLFRQNSTIAIALIPAMVGILGLGLTDTFIDEPQISLFVFSIFFAAMQWPVNVNKAVKN